MSEPQEGFHVWIAWDDEASVWYVRDSDLPGLVAEGETVDALRAKVLGLVYELAPLNRHRIKVACSGRAAVQFLG
jgi:hypothetical protein